MDFGGWERREELGEDGGGERVIRIYCMEKNKFLTLKRIFLNTDERY